MARRPRLVPLSRKNARKSPGEVKDLEEPYPGRDRGRFGSLTIPREVYRYGRRFPPSHRTTATIHPRKVSSVSQRPFTRDEYRRILDVAEEPWRSAVQIAWFTGLREKDVFTLKWTEIAGDLIRKLPAKTARFRREVLIPIHPSLAAVLQSLPRKGERVLGAWKYNPNYIGFRRAFGDILTRAGIEGGDGGRVCFNSLRNSFISRCDAAGIPRHAVRGIVGHVSDDMTDLYSHDETSARLIQTLPE